MATLALAAVGAAAGSALLPAGVSVLGATLTGAAIGSQIGALAGSYVDNALFGSSGQSRTVEGRRLSDLHVTASTEGAAIPRVYGRARFGGQIIWATDFDEEVVTTSQSAGGGKGGFGGGSKVRTTEYLYYANFAVGLCEGQITRIGRMWADGAELDPTRVTWRLYTGTETQPVDSLIAAREGANNAPAYRGLAYIVFEHMALKDYGNRIPQLSFEVYRKQDSSDQDIRGVVLIPGTGEFAYSPTVVREYIADGHWSLENQRTMPGADWEVALDQLQDTLPKAKQVSLIVSWFGTDLRAGNCLLRPGVDIAAKINDPISWSVAGLARAGGLLISKSNGLAAYGGTPSDQTVIAAIKDLKTRGLKVTLTPFILMDVPAGNTLPNPYGGASQPAYPWRGRITCHPAAGQAGTVDKTAAAASQIGALVGTVTPAHFAIAGETVTYSGPANEWSYRRFILHHAALAKAAGGVEAFQIGSELRGLSTVRSNANTYPFVSALIAIANDVRAILGPSTKIIYAADWSEYFGHQPGDGTGDVYFHLDPLWSSSNIDAIGIDVYWPLADWREGRAHLDYQAGARSIHDLNYLKSNVQGGEGYDWYYASDANRQNQVRSPITDGSGKPWVFRFKDIKNWWLNPHYNRPGGIESTTPTAWVPQSKPFWFTEIGCPAVDMGANQPNVFVDPKSVESALPYFSRGVRNDLMQSRFLHAFRDAFDWTKPGYVTGLNPVSQVTGARMVDLDHIFVYCWDSRPYPSFPLETTYWGDSANWPLGHWLNGRLGGSPLDEMVTRLLHDFGYTDFDAGALSGTITGYVVERVMPARDALQPLELAYFFDSLETGGQIAFRHRGAIGPVANYAPDNLVEGKADAPLYVVTRGQETELPSSAKIRFISGEDEYRQVVAEARRLTGASGRVSQADLPIVLEDNVAGALTETWLFESWAARERASFALPPSALGLEPGDVVTLSAGGVHRTLRVTDVSDHGVRDIEARSIDLDVYDRVRVEPRVSKPLPPVQVGSPALQFMDLPLIDASAPPESGYVAAVQVPWPGSVAVFSSPQLTGYQLRSLVSAPATYGVTLDPVSPGIEGRIDRRARFRVKLTNGQLASADLVSVLGGVNTAAIKNAGGDWEIIQFLNAVLVDAATYEVSAVLRGQFGTEAAALGMFGVNTPFVVLDAAVTRVPLTSSDLNLPYNWKYGPGNRDIGDVSYVTASYAFKGVGLRPYAPARVTGSRANGDLTLNWQRRTRLGGDPWDVTEVPLGETSEAYQVDVLNGAAVVRTLMSAAPSVVYTQAQQIADFGSAQARVSVKVYQMSSLGLRGSARAAMV